MSLEDLRERRARLEPIYLRVAADLRAIRHNDLADLIDEEREILWGRPGAPEPRGIMFMDPSKILPPLS